jgi:type IV pilus assembly protein PilY1
MAPFPNPPAWAAGTAYLAGVHEVTAGSLIYLCTRSGTSGESAPTWPTTFGATVTDGTCSWVCAQHARAAWQANHAYTAGGSAGPYPWPDQIIAGGYLWQCATSGTSGSTQPTWPTPAGWSPGSSKPIPYTVVTDGGVTWSCVAWQGNTMMLSDPYIAVL